MLAVALILAAQYMTAQGWTNYLSHSSWLDGAALQSYEVVGSGDYSSYIQYTKRSPKNIIQPYVNLAGRAVRNTIASFPSNESYKITRRYSAYKYVDDMRLVFDDNSESLVWSTTFMPFANETVDIPTFGWTTDPIGDKQADWRQAFVAFGDHYLHEHNMPRKTVAFDLLSFSKDPSTALAVTNLGNRANINISLADSMEFNISLPSYYNEDDFYGKSKRMNPRKMAAANYALGMFDRTFHIADDDSVITNTTFSANNAVSIFGSREIIVPFNLGEEDYVEMNLGSVGWSFALTNQTITTTKSASNKIRFTCDRRPSSTDANVVPSHTETFGKLTREIAVKHLEDWDTYCEAEGIDKKHFICSVHGQGAYAGAMIDGVFCYLLTLTIKDFDSWREYTYTICVPNGTGAEGQCVKANINVTSTASRSASGSWTDMTELSMDGVNVNVQPKETLPNGVSAYNDSKAYYVTSITGELYNELDYLDKVTNLYRSVSDTIEDNFDVKNFVLYEQSTVVQKLFSIANGLGCGNIYSPIDLVNIPLGKLKSAASGMTSKIRFGGFAFNSLHFQWYNGQAYDIYEEDPVRGDVDVEFPRNVVFSCSFETEGDSEITWDGHNNAFYLEASSKVATDVHWNFAPFTMKHDN